MKNSIFVLLAFSTLGSLASAAEEKKAENRKPAANPGEYVCTSVGFSAQGAVPGLMNQICDPKMPHSLAMTAGTVMFCCIAK